MMLRLKGGDSDPAANRISQSGMVPILVTSRAPCVPAETIGKTMVARRLTSALASGILLVGLGGCETHKKERPQRRPPAVAASSASPETPTQLSDKARIQFASLEHDLGTITDAEPVTHVFKFKNVGTETLVIENVGSS